jgi:hypothetical protein
LSRFHEITPTGSIVREDVIPLKSISEVKVPPSIATSSCGVAKTPVEVVPVPGLSVRGRLTVLSARTKPIRAKARWIRCNLGYPIRQSIEFVLRDPAWDERGLSVFMRRSIPGCLVIQQRLIRVSHLVIAILTALTGKSNSRSQPF